MNTATLILAILNFRDATGYEIKKLSSEGTFCYFVDISYGSIYPTLARLEADEFVSCRVEMQTGKPDRKIYSITDKGRAELINGLSQPPQSDVFKSEFLLVAINAPVVGSKRIAAAVAERLAALETKIAALDESLIKCDDPASRWVIGYGRHMIDTNIRYLKSHGDELVALAARSAASGETAEAAE